MAAETVRHGGADVVIMACTGTGLDMAAAVEQGLCLELGQRVPVIDPVKAAIHLAEACITSRLAHSKVGWPHLADERSEYRFAVPTVAE